MRTPVALALSMVALMTWSPGCASFGAQRRRNAVLEKQLSATRYQLPLDDFWQEVRKFLAERQYPLAGDDALAIGQQEPNFAQRLFSPAKSTYALADDVGLLQQVGIVAKGGKPVKGYGLETGWHAGSPRYRVRAEAAQVPDGVGVVLVRIEEDIVDHRDPTVRDLDLELELAKRLDPENARRIEEAAAAK